MQYELKLFEDPENTEFRVIDRDGEPWFVLSEVCKKLELTNVSETASRLDDDEKDNIRISDAIGRTRSTSIINESGLYSVVLRSTKPEAKRFKKWITSEVLPSIRKEGRYGKATPAFIKRFNENWNRVTPGYFSVISELAIRLHGRLEMEGHTMADKSPKGTENRPDGSVGKLFMSYLREEHPVAAASVSKYRHKTPETECDANQFPIKYLPLFIEFVDREWIPTHSMRYFRTRDPAALPFLQKLLPASSSSPALR